jgi:hypothetical protein
MMDYDAHIGFSIYEIFEQCYQYNENACFIASNLAKAEVFMRDGFEDPEDCRIDSITFADLMRGFGGTLGEYAMEREAFLRFKQVAERQSVRFTVEPYDGDDDLFVVKIEGIVYNDWD